MLFIEQFLDEVFCDIQNIQGRGRDYQPKPKTKADNPYRDLDYAGYHKNPNLITALLHIEGKKSGHDSKWN